MTTVNARKTPRIFLRKFRHAHSPHVHKWLTDEVVSRWLPQSHGVRTRRDAEAWTRNVVKSKTTLAFAIVDAENKTLVGIATLHDIRPHQGTAEVGVIVGNAALWRHGFGTTAADKLLEIAFDRLKLSVVEAHVLSGDKRAIAALKAYGFKAGGIVPSWFRGRGNSRSAKAIFFLTKQQWRHRGR